MAKRSRVSVQLIVRRGARERYRKLKEKTANLPVEVTWDRRRSERRAASAESAPERRKGPDRRRKPPFTWELSDFVVVEKPRRPKRKK